MAKNWTIAEAYEALKNFDKAAIADFGKRFPLATYALMSGSNLDILASAIPERVTMRKIEMALKEGVDTEEADDIDDVAEDEAEMTPKKAGRPRKGTAKSDDEKKAAAKARREARKAKKAAAMNEPVEDDEDEDDSPEESYDGLNAVELFKLCKKRGITAQPKKASKYYIDLLKADDAKANDAEDEGDDWEDDEEEAPAPKKKAGRPKKEATKVEAKKASKAKTKPEPEEDEDDDEDEEDDWDI